MKLLSLLALPLVVISACASDGGFVDQAAEVEGIYRVDSHLLNDAACTRGGVPVTDMHGFAFAKRGSVLGTDFLELYSCASLDDCRAKAALKQFEGATAFAFTLTGTDDKGLTGFESTTGFSNGSGTCSMPELSSISLVLDGAALRLEKSTRIGADYAAHDGVCTTDKGRAAAESAPCSEMETLDATLVEAL